LVEEWVSKGGFLDVPLDNSFQYLEQEV